jgi:hypothetical protein
MDPVILEVDVIQRPNGQRVARLLREMQCVCQINRRRLGMKAFQGRERRAFDASHTITVAR